MLREGRPGPDATFIDLPERQIQTHPDVLMQPSVASFERPLDVLAFHATNP